MKIEATYDYTDRHGELLYQVVRFVGKQFGCRRPIGKAWAWCLNAGWYAPPSGAESSWRWCSVGSGNINLPKGAIELPAVLKVPYHLPELVDPARFAEPVIVTEGEKDVETLRSIGFLATTNALGAGKWDPNFSIFLRDRRVVMIPDYDAPGFQHSCDVIASAVAGGAQSIRCVQWNDDLVEEGGDITYYLETRCPKHEKSTPQSLRAERRKAVTELVLEHSYGYVIQRKGEQ